MKRGLVAIFMPSFNRPNLIERSIKSILNQSYTNWKLYILDNSSPQVRNQTRKIIKSYVEKDERIKFFYNDNLIHQGEAYNKLMFQYSERDEEFTMFGADDTMFHPQKLKLLVNYLNANLSHKIICGMIVIRHNSGKVYQSFGNFKVINSASCAMNLVQPLIRRSFIDKVGRMDEVNMHGKSPDAAYWNKIQRKTHAKFYGAIALNNKTELDSSNTSTYARVDKHRNTWKNWGSGVLYE